MMHQPVAKNITVLTYGKDPANDLLAQLALLYETQASPSHTVASFKVHDAAAHPHGAADPKRLHSSLRDFLEKSDHLAIFYHTIHGSPPGGLLALMAELWGDGFGARRKNGYWGSQWSVREPLHKGKTARLVVLDDLHPWLARLRFGNTANTLTRSFLRPAGFAVSHTHMGPSALAPEWKHSEWRQYIAELGRAGL